MTDNPDRTRSRSGTMATIAGCIIAFGVLMGIRNEFGSPWVQTFLAGCAGAFMGLALYQAKKLWPRRK